MSRKVGKIQFTLEYVLPLNLFSFLVSLLFLPPLPSEHWELGGCRAWEKGGEEVVEGGEVEEGGGEGRREEGGGWGGRYRPQ